MSVGEICNREVVVTGGEASVVDAARLMRQYHVGDLVVVEERAGGRVPVGILTDRDLVVEVLAEDVPTEGLKVADVMSHELITAREDTELSGALAQMRAAGIRRMPVVDAAGMLVGIITMDDVLDLLAEGMQEMVGLVTRQRQREARQRP